MDSIWQENTPVQTLVIGAGLAGILSAYFLQKSGQQKCAHEELAIWFFSHPLMPGNLKSKLPIPLHKLYIT